MTQNASKQGKLDSFGAMFLFIFLPCMWGLGSQNDSPKKTLILLTKRAEVLEIAVGAVFDPPRFSLVRIFARDMIADILTKEFWGWGWGQSRILGIDPIALIRALIEGTDPAHRFQDTLHDFQRDTLGQIQGLVDHFSESQEAPKGDI